MPRFIIKIESYYFEWSTVVDAPVTTGLTLKEFKEYYLLEYGRKGQEGLGKRLERVERMGTSCLPLVKLEDLLEGNRAGALEGHLTKEEIMDLY